jgi:hypothetical protein
VTVNITELEGLRDLAALEGFARLDDLTVLLNVALSAPQALQSHLLEVARGVYEARPTTLPAPRDPLETQLWALVGIIVQPGLRGVNFRTLDASMDALLTALEDSHRARESHPLEDTTFAALEAVKGTLFGRALNIAERSRLRGFYERTRLLKSW